MSVELVNPSALAYELDELGLSDVTEAIVLQMIEAGELRGLSQGEQFSTLFNIRYDNHVQTLRVWFNKLENEDHPEDEETHIEYYALAPCEIDAG